MKKNLYALVAQSDMITSEVEAYTVEEAVASREFQEYLEGEDLNDFAIYQRIPGSLEVNGIVFKAAK